MIDPRKAALLIIDMQHGFVDPSSALCVQGALSTVPACTRALDRARALGMPVFHVVREYAADGSDVEACRHATWVEGGKPVSRACASPRTLEEYAPLSPQPGDRVIVKPRFSAFFGTQLDLVLRRLGVGTVLPAGTTTPNCIRTTCYDALSLDYNVVVLEDCTSSRTPEVQAANIEDMAYIGAHIMTCGEFCTRGLSDVRDAVAEARVACAAQAAFGAGENGACR